jgi:nucleoside-diphosphate-sugar epimerase
VGISPESVAGAQRGTLLVLGGSGFIGTRLAPLLLERGWGVRIGDIQPSAAFPELSTECDVTSIESLRKAVAGVEAIINLAAVHRDDVRPLSRYDEVNVEGAKLVCQAAREGGIAKIVFTSSVAVYGFQPKPVDETGPFAPFNAYGKTKLAAEAVYRAWAEQDAARTLVMVRPTVVFGEGNRGNVYNLLHQIASGKFLMVGAGKNVKSMAYVGNVAAFLAHTLSMEPGIHIANYVDKPDMDTITLVEHIWKCLGREGRPKRFPKSLAMLGGHALDMVARISGRTFPISAIRVRKFCESTQFRADRVKETGFVPPYSLSEALARTIAFEFPAK